LVLGRVRNLLGIPDKYYIASQTDEETLVNVDGQYHGKFPSDFSHYDIM